MKKVRSYYQIVTFEMEVSLRYYLDFYHVWKKRFSLKKVLKIELCFGFYIDFLGVFLLKKWSFVMFFSCFFFVKMIEKIGSMIKKILIYFFSYHNSIWNLDLHPINNLFYLNKNCISQKYVIVWLELLFSNILGSFLWV